MELASIIGGIMSAMRFKNGEMTSRIEISGRAMASG